MSIYRLYRTVDLCIATDCATRIDRLASKVQLLQPITKI